MFINIVSSTTTIIKSIHPSLTSLFVHHINLYTCISTAHNAF